MAPVIVFDRDGDFLAATGSAGGPAIIAYVLKTLIGTLDWHMTMQAAISLPNLVAHGDHFTAETAKFAPELLVGMSQLGSIRSRVNTRSPACRACWRTPTAALKAARIRAARASRSATD
jgi:gamma-glutamyltranspeptidase